MADQELSRRDVLKAGFAAAIAGATSSKESGAEPAAMQPEPGAEPAAKNLYDTLEKYSFTDQQGKDVSVKALSAQLKEHPVAVSFGFSRCQGICPFTNKNLATIGKRENDLRFVMVSSDTRDNASQESRDGYKKSLTDAGINPKNVTTLYPKDYDQLIQMQRDFGAGLVAQPPGHTSYVFLHQPDGEQLLKSRGNRAGIHADFADGLDSIKKQAHGR